MVINTRRLWRWFCLLCLAAGFCGVRAGAQVFDVGITRTPNPVIVSNQLVYTVNLTNRSGITLSNVVVTQTHSADISLFEAVNSFGTVTNFPTSIAYFMFPMTNNGFATLTLDIDPLVVGNLTNAIVATAPFVTGVTNIVVTEVVAAIADLAVSLTGPPPGVLVNDLMTYTVGITNLGPGTVPNVVLSNALPASVVLISPTNQNQVITFTNNSLVFRLVSLAAGRSTNFIVTVQPTNAGTLTFSARASAPSLSDTNTANDVASTNVTVGDFLAGQLVATLSGGQTYNPQTGFMEQTIHVQNVGTNDVPAARVIISGLTVRLFNAVGTNAGNPFVAYVNTLTAGAGVDLKLELFNPARVPVPLDNTNLTAVGVPPLDLTPPSGTQSGITRFKMLPGGVFLVEFVSVPGKRYQIIYSDDPDFSNAVTAIPPVTAPADRVQWLDYGPPKTISQPMASPQRLYKVIQLP